MSDISNRGGGAHPSSLSLADRPLKTPKTFSPRLGLIIIFIVSVLSGLALISTMELSPSSPNPLKIKAHPSMGLAMRGGEVETLAKGDPSTALLLRYDLSGEKRRYGVRIKQTVMTTQGDTTTQIVTRWVATVTLAPSKGDASKLFVSFHGFKVRVEADGEPLDIPAVHRLLKGMKVEVTTDKRQGFLGDSIFTGANPQVRRMLSMLVDVLRQGHPRLPKEPVGLHAKWHEEIPWSAEAGLASTLAVETTWESTDDPKAHHPSLVLAQRLTLSLKGAVSIEDSEDREQKVLLQGEGDGQLHLILEDPTAASLFEARGHFEHHQTMTHAELETTQKTTLHFELLKCADDHIQRDDPKGLYSEHPIFETPLCASPHEDD